MATLAWPPFRGSKRAARIVGPTVCRSHINTSAVAAICKLMAAVMSWCWYRADDLVRSKAGRTGSWGPFGASGNSCWYWRLDRWKFWPKSPVGWSADRPNSPMDYLGNIITSPENNMHSSLQEGITGHKLCWFLHQASTCIWIWTIRIHILISSTFNERVC